MPLSCHTSKFSLQMNEIAMRPNTVYYVNFDHIKKCTLQASTFDTQFIFSKGVLNDNLLCQRRVYCTFIIFGSCVQIVMRSLINADSKGAQSMQ